MKNSSVGENFSLADVYKLSERSFKDRVQFFSDTIENLEKSEEILYRRRIDSKMENRVSIGGKEMIMMGSNNYLGFATHPKIINAVENALVDYGAGVAGPPLLNGTTKIHQQLEQALAQFKSKEDAVIFPSGFQTNLGWTSALIQDGDVLVYDELSHASLMDSIELLKNRPGISCYGFKHNSPEHLEMVLERVRRKSGASERQIFVFVEGVYSMDGDLAALDVIAPICRKNDVFLIVDDAHGTGVTGSGRGTPEHFGVSDMSR